MDRNDSFEALSESACIQPNIHRDFSHLAGIQDLIGFHTESVAELRKEFEAAVDDYLEACEKLNRKPQRPYSGKLMLRIDPGIHAKAAMRAEAEGKSLNAWAQEALQRATT